MKSHECARALGACLAAGCACVSYGTSAYADWEAIPDIKLEAEMNDNPALNMIGTTDSQVVGEATRLLADAAIRIRKVEPRGELSFEPRVRGDTYAEDQAKNLGLASTDLFLRSTGFQRGQTVRLGYSADIAREQILGVEFLETMTTDPTAEDPSAIATTQVGINEERTRVGIAPYVEIAMNSRSTVILDGHLVDVDYATGQLAGRTDFLERSIGGEYRRALGDQRGSFGVHVFATGYEAAINSNTTDTRGIDFVYSRDMSELWSWSTSIGTQRSDFAVNAGGRRVRGTDDTPTYAFGIRKRGERSSMRAELMRRMSPDSLGFVAPRDEIRVDWTRMMSPRVTGRLGLRGINAEGVPLILGSDRQYGRMVLAVDWALRPTWSFVASYAYARASSDVTIGEPAVSNALTLGIRYHGRSMRPRTLTQPETR
jgi:hypothetical protein